MTKLYKLLSLLAFMAMISCNSNYTSDKENELLKKENALLLKEKELNSKAKIQEAVNSNVKTSKLNNNNWKQFKHRYGFTIDLPNYFREGSLTASGIQYYTADLDEDIILTVEAIVDGSSISLAKEYQDNTNTLNGISYKVLKDSWYVISGQDEEDIYYLKSYIKSGRTFCLSLHYPMMYKDIFDSILPRIAKSFE